VTTYVQTDNVRTDRHRSIRGSLTYTRTFKGDLYVRASARIKVVYVHTDTSCTSTIVINTTGTYYLLLGVLRSWSTCAGSVFEVASVRAIISHENLARIASESSIVNFHVERISLTSSSGCLGVRRYEYKYTITLSKIGYLLTLAYIITPSSCDQIPSYCKPFQGKPSQWKRDSFTSSRKSQTSIAYIQYRHSPSSHLPVDRNTRSSKNPNWSFLFYFYNFID
jgi:hypothetical protein